MVSVRVLGVLCLVCFCGLCLVSLWAGDVLLNLVAFVKLLASYLANSLFVAVCCAGFGLFWICC